ncbi:hypothetical protein TWF718_005754 [Orbilia javanica]|uniref:Uncharacterized protein n=1 Tax=Orbilia javanica TaxID=47235 RepID=A0AAN8RJ72_9PEZI
MIKGIQQYFESIKAGGLKIRSMWTHNTMGLLDCPNEILGEIFAYLNNEQPKVYTWGSLLQSYDSGLFDDTSETMEPAELAAPEPARQVIIKSNNKARAALFDLRLVCKRFEAVATPFAFSTIHLCHSLRLGPLVTNDLADRTEQNRFARYINHIVISPMSLLPRASLYQAGLLFGADHTRWIETFKSEISHLFSNLPDSVTELTIRDLEAIDSEATLVKKINRLFFKAFAFSSRGFTTTQLQKVNIYAQDSENIEYLWADFETIGSIVSWYPRIPTRPLRPPYLENVGDMDIRANTFSPRSLKRITKYLPKNLNHLSLTSPYNYYPGRTRSLNFRLENTQNLRSVVIEGISNFGQPAVQFLQTLVNASKIHIYGSDIDDVNIYEQNYVKLCWGQVLTVLNELPCLVDFQAGNLSYYSIRGEYRYLNVARVWMFTEYPEDFEAFQTLRLSLLNKRCRLGLPEHGWLSQTSIRQADPKSLEFNGLTPEAPLNVPDHERLALKRTRSFSHREYGGTGFSISGAVARRFNEMVYLMSATERYRLERGCNVAEADEWCEIALSWEEL